LPLEFNIKISKKDGGIIAGIQSFIENAENELDFKLRKALNVSEQH
jgi:hypothetical protein